MKSAEPRALAACSYTDGTLPDELMWLILFRCPVKSIFRFKCVSKTWDRSLSSSWFRMAYISFQEKSQVPRSLLGLFNLKIERSMLVVSIKPELRGPHEFFFLPTSTEGEPFTRISFLDRVGSFRGISNGLILCGDHPDFHVFNPITRQLFSLPRSPFDFESMSSTGDSLKYRAASPGFVSSECDNDFKVVLPIVNELYGTYGQKFMLMGMYSSKTRLWKESRVVAVGRFQVYTGGLSTSIGGTFFWSTCDVRLLAYDPKTAENSVQLMRLPPRGRTSRFPTLCQSTNGFLQCAVDSHDFPGFRVYILAKRLANYGYDHVVSSKEWIPTYTVRLDMLDAIWAHKFQRSDNPQHDRALSCLICIVTVLWMRMLSVLPQFSRNGEGRKEVEIEEEES